MPVRPLFTLLLTALLVMTGCTAVPDEPALLRIDAHAYPATFAAAADAVRREGLDPELRDLRGGVIETAEAHVPGLLEPWRLDGSDLERRWEATLSRERRRARIAFAPASEPSGEGPPDADGDGPALLDPAERDLLAVSDPLEMRVWVYIERAHRPGVRRGLWSRRLTSRYDIVPPDSVAPLPNATWTPIARDHEFEQRLLARIEATLSKAP